MFKDTKENYQLLGITITVAPLLIGGASKYVDVLCIVAGLIIFAAAGPIARKSGGEVKKK